MCSFHFRPLLWRLLLICSTTLLCSTLQKKTENRVRDNLPLRTKHSGIFYSGRILSTNLRSFHELNLRSTLGVFAKPVISTVAISESTPVLLRLHLFVSFKPDSDVSWDRQPLDYDIIIVLATNICRYGSNIFDDKYCQYFVGSPLRKVLKFIADCPIC